MRTPLIRRRTRSLPRPIALLMTIALMLAVLAPIGEQIASAQPDPTEEVDAAEPTLEPTAADAIPTEPAPEATDEVIATEKPTAIPASQLTISVYRCDHPDFDTGFSENLQRVINECTGPGSASFTIESGSGQQQSSGSTLSVEILGYLYLTEAVPAGYDSPIANCFVYGPDGALADQIGPGETSGGSWKVGSIAGNVHCDWYQVDRGVGNVYVVNMACPSTAGLFPEPSMTDLVSMCTEPAGQKQFFVVHSGGLERMGVSGGEFNDVLFEAIPAGPIEIWMDEPGAFESARVFCQVNTLEGVEISPFTEVSVDSFRASGITLGHGQRLHCSWFNIQQGPGLDPGGNETAPTPTEPVLLEPSDLIVKKYTCPNNYKPTNPNAEPLADCTPGPDGINFTLSDADPNTVDLQTMTGDSMPNAVQFGGLQPGEYTITETIPAGTGDIFVLGCGGGGGIDPIPQFIDGTTTVNLPPGVISTCPWFNVPSPGGGQAIPRLGSPEASATEGSPVAIQAALTGTSSISIAKYACPAGFDVSTVDANPTALCTPLPGISFDIDDDLDDGAGWYIETDATGTGSVGGLAAGRYSIQEGVRNGTTATFVWDCYEAGGTSNLTDPIAVGNTVDLDIPEGYAVHCDWFNVTGGTARVVVAKHACDYLVPAYTLDQAGLAAQCTIDTGTVKMYVVSDTYQQEQPASNSPLTLASFQDVPTGFVAIGEENIAGWATAIVYCGIYDENGAVISPVMKMNVLQSRSIYLELHPGQVASCDWYNVAQGFVDVTANKHLCPEGFDAYAASPSDLALGCTLDPGSVKFSLHDESLYLEERTITAAAPGTWTDVPSGDIRIEEMDLPTGYGMPVVVCRIDFEDGSAVSGPSFQPITGRTWTYVNLSAGQVLTCDWYNVPGGQGAVSIWKQACPPSVNVAEMSSHELELACQEDIPAITFDLSVGSVHRFRHQHRPLPVRRFPGDPPRRGHDYRASGRAMGLLGRLLPHPVRHQTSHR